MLGYVWGQSPLLPSGHQTWQRKRDHKSAIFLARNLHLQGSFKPAMFDENRGRSHLSVGKSPLLVRKSSINHPYFPQNLISTKPPFSYGFPYVSYYFPIQHGDFTYKYLGLTLTTNHHSQGASFRASHGRIENDHHAPSSARPERWRCAASGRLKFAMLVAAIPLQKKKGFNGI